MNNVVVFDIIKFTIHSISVKTGTYIKRISLENNIVCYDLKEVAPLLNTLRIIGNNINQVAKKANETNNIYADDIAKMEDNFTSI